MESLDILIRKLNCALDFKRKVVGVRFLANLDEFENSPALNLKNPINYCTMVKSASNGHSIKATTKDFKCKSAPRVLGIDSSDEKNSKGENWARLGLYKDSELSSKVRENLMYSKDEIYGLEIASLEYFSASEPDIVIIITNPYNVMRIVQGYSYNFGMPKNINMIGNQAVCLECTAVPYLTQDINISMLCIGTRHKNKWDDDEMAVGIPFSKFSKVVQGVYDTINIMESNENKKKIEAKLANENFDDLNIKYDYNYYMDV